MIDMSRNLDCKIRCIHLHGGRATASCNIQTRRQVLPHTCSSICRHAEHSNARRAFLSRLLSFVVVSSSSATEIRLGNTSNGTNCAASAATPRNPVRKDVSRFLDAASSETDTEVALEYLDEAVSLSRDSGDKTSIVASLIARANTFILVKVG